MIVIDLGCCNHDRDTSIGPLVDRFAPEVLFGFDPLLDTNDDYDMNGTRVRLRNKAAWTRNGTLTLMVGNSPLGSTVMRERGLSAQAERTVRCFDLARFIQLLPDGELVLKLDVEGAEYPLLQQLADTGTLSKVGCLLVEWHGLHGDHPRPDVEWEPW